MDTAAPQPTDDPVFHLLEQARQLILRLTAYIDSILERLGAAHPSNALLRKLTAYALVPAESALRRVVLILAAHQPLPERPKPRVLPAPAPRDLSASFTRRLLALHAALNDPHAVAARWLRRHFAARVPKGCPLSPHRIPGQRKTLPEHDRNTLRNLTDLVLDYFTTDTS